MIADTLSTEKMSSFYLFNELWAESHYQERADQKKSLRKDWIYIFNVFALLRLQQLNVHWSIDQMRWEQKINK